MMPSDKEMLDWLEQQANEAAGLLLHAEHRPTGRRGLGLNPGGNNPRTLREAIALAMGSEGVALHRSDRRTPHG